MIDRTVLLFHQIVIKIIVNYWIILPLNNYLNTTNKNPCGTAFYNWIWTSAVTNVGSHRDITQRLGLDFKAKALKLIETLEPFFFPSAPTHHIISILFLFIMKHSADYRTLISCVFDHCDNESCLHVCIFKFKWIYTIQSYTDRK